MWTNWKAVGIAACTGLALSLTAQARPTTPETEPNDNKTQANAVTLANGDSVSGSTTGTSTTVAGVGSADYWKIKTATLTTPAITRHEMVVSSTPTTGAAFVQTIRGLTQTVGAVNAGTDAAFATSATGATTNAFRIAWYGFGKGEEVYYRVTGSTTAVPSTVGQTYTATLTDTPVTPTALTGATIFAGTVTIGVSLSTASDSEVWLFDSNFNAIALGGNDDPTATSPAALFDSGLQRNLAPGTYYIALARYNLSTNLPAAIDDVWRSESVLDFPNAICTSPGNPALMEGTLQVDDAYTNSVSTLFSMPAGTNNHIFWYSFTLATPPVPSGIGLANPNPGAGGGSTELTVTVTPAAGGVLNDISSAGTAPTSGVFVDISALSGNPAPDYLNLTRQGVTADWKSGSLAIPPTALGVFNLPFTIVQGPPIASTGTGTIVLNVAPGNDNCASAASFVVPPIGGTVTGSNVGSTHDGIADCDTQITGLDVYHSFTPATAGPWQIDLCSTATVWDSMLSVHHSGCPVNDTIGSGSGNQVSGACDDENCDPPNAGNGVLSKISSVTLAAGTTYTIRVAGWSGTDTGAYTLTVTDLGAVAGSCCSPDGTCLAVASGGACADPCKLFVAGGSCSPAECAPVSSGGQTCGCAKALIAGATPSPFDLALSTGTSTVSCSLATNGLWYSFTAPAAGDYVIVANATAGAGFPQIAAFTTCGGSELACQNPCAGTNLQVTLTLALNQTVVFRVTGCSGAGTWSGTVAVVVPAITGTCCNDTTGECSVVFNGAACPLGSTANGSTTCAPSPCPASGSCCTGTACAVILDSNAGTCPGTYTFGATCSPINPCFAADDCSTTTLVATLGANAVDSTNATTSFNINPSSLCGTLSGSGGSNDIFIKFTAPATAAYTLDTCGPTGYDSVLSIHSACPSTSANVLACNDDSADNTPCPESGLRSRIPTVNLTAGTLYFIRVAGYGTTAGARGPISVNIAYVAPTEIGSCCTGTACVLSDIAGCPSGSGHVVGNTCSPNPCFSSTQNCCRGTTCNSITAGTCTGVVAGSNSLVVTTCGAGNALSTCCFADYNHDGIQSIDDLFLYFNAYFTASPWANVGGDGVATPTIDDLFLYINAYFSTCAP